MQPEEPLLIVRDVSKHFGDRGKVFGRRAATVVRAVDGVSFSIHRGETLALVGESGSGKSTLGRLTIRLLEPTSGEVHYGAASMDAASPAALRALRRKMQIIFQDPYSSLNPRMSVGQTLADPLVIHGVGTASERRERVRDVLRLVEMHPDHAERYPHEFSGGQRQRIGIARALMLDPEYVVCDEPVSALDVSIQAQIINLLRGIQRQRSLSYLFISHNLAVVRHIADRVAVMYLGRIVEIAPKRAIFGRPLHPYTQALMSAALEPDPELRTQRVLLKGEPPSPLSPPSGCRFRLQCRLAQPLCATVEPPLENRADGTEHLVACHFAGAA